MKHSTNKRTLGRSRSQRTALVRGLAMSLFEHGKITTTAAKAKELRPFAEKLITTAKAGTVAARRNVATSLGEPKPEVVAHIFADIAPKYKDRNGGYTRIIKLGVTSGKDESVIELV